MKGINLLAILALLYSCQKEPAVTKQALSVWEAKAGVYQGRICYHERYTDVTPPYSNGYTIDSCYFGELELELLADSIYQLTFQYESLKEFEVKMQTLDSSWYVTGSLTSGYLTEISISNDSLYFFFDQKNSRMHGWNYKITAHKKP